MSDKEDFIAGLYPAATKVSAETGMSWELILAQAAQETGWGAHVLSGTNNIFNIKVQGDWDGPTKTFNVWEIENGKKVWKDQEFRVYASVEDALRDRVKFLKENPRYAQAGLFDEETKGNLEKEAAVLQKAGYATDPNYAKQLVSVYNGPTMQRAIQQARMIEANPHPADQLHHSEVRHESNGDVRVLKQGDHGDTVSKLQVGLARLGYSDTQNHALQVDAHFGPATRHAVEAFQRDHHLTEDGKAGPETLAAIRGLSQTPITFSLDQDQHPGHALYGQALNGVMAIDAHMGRTSDRRTIHLAAALTVAAKAEGLNRIDLVTLNEDGSRAFAMQHTSPFKTLASVSTERAIQTSIEQSSMAWQQAARGTLPDLPAMPNQRRFQEEQTQTRQHIPGVPGM